MPRSTTAEFQSSEPLVVFGEDLTILSWNEAVEGLTGIPAGDAIGKPCWEVLAAHDDRGDLVCHAGCSRARMLREGRCVPTVALHARTAQGRRRVQVETIRAESNDGLRFMHLLHDARGAPHPAGSQPGRAPRLTPRQLEILGLLAEGHLVKAIAVELGVTPTTVRNHVRLLFLALGAHSQLEAVARARAFKLI